MAAKTNMNDMMRSGRADLSAYMYPKASDSGATPADTSTAPASAPKDAGIQVLQPGDETPPNSYVYEPGDNGAWMVYPPGTPCDTKVERVALDHPATASEFAEMDKALNVESGSTDAESTSEDTGEVAE